MNKQNVVVLTDQSDERELAIAQETLLHAAQSKNYVELRLNSDAIESLKNNLIPIELAEKISLVDPNSPLSFSLESTIRPIVDRIVDAIPETSFSKKEFASFTGQYREVQLVFSASDEPNAFVFKYTCPPIVCINKGLLVGENAVRSVDALAHIIAHEITHKALEAKYGPGASSKGEEGLADAIAVELIHHAGFDIRESEEFFKKLSREAKTQDEKFAAIVSEHPLDSTRVSLLQAGITGIEKSVERLCIEPTALSDTDIPGLAKTLEFIPLREPSSFKQTFQKSLEASKESSPLKMLRAIREGLNEANFDDYRTLKDLEQLIKELKYPKYNEEAIAEADLLADQILDICGGKFTNHFHEEAVINTEAQISYNLLSDQIVGRPSISSIPLGRLKTVDSALFDFVNAKNKNEILTKAQALSDLLEKEPLLQDSICKSMDWRNFNPKIKRGATVPWQSHYDAAIHLNSESRQHIIRALIGIGVNDARFYPEMSLKTYIDTMTRKLSHLPEVSGKVSAGVTIRSSNLEISRSGSITEFGLQGSILSEQLEGYRYSKLPTLADRYFKNISETNPDPEELAVLETASALLNKYFSDNTLGSDYLIGLENLHKNPRLFCALNQGAMRRCSSLQMKVAEQLSFYQQSNHPKAREIIRQVLSVHEDNRTNPFHFEFVKAVDPESDSWNIEDWEYEESVILKYPLARYLLGLTPEIVTPSEKVSLLLAPDLLTKGRGIELCSVGKLEILQSILKDSHLAFATPVKSYAQLFKKHHEMRLDPGNTLTIDEQFSMLEAEFRRLSLKRLPTPAEMFKLKEFYPEWTIADDPVLADQIRKRYLRQPPILSSDPAVAVGEWQVINESILLPPDKLYNILGKIAIQTKELADGLIREDIFHDILSGPRIVDPKVRELLIELWSKEVRLNIGQDDGSEQFCDQLRKRTEGIIEIEPALRVELLNALGRELQTQKAGTSVLESALPSISRESLENTQISGIGIEEILSLTRREPVMRFEVLKFLSRPLSAQSVSAFLAIFPESDSGSRNNLGNSWLPITNDQELWEKFEKAVKIESANQLHRNFWAAPFEARTLMARELFLPFGNTSQKEEDEMFNLALEEAFSQKFHYGQEAQEFVRAYIRNVPEYSTHLSIAALMVAAERTNNRGAGIGFALASFLETMGPAETKAGQAAESHPSIPDDIRADLRRLKTSADEPTRWNLWQQIEEKVPDEIRKDIARIDDILGSASFYVVAAVTMKDDSQKVLALLRDHALTRAENGFGLMSAMAIDLGRNHKAFNTLEELIEQAKELAKVESNPIISKTQIEMAQSIYNGAKVTVDGVSYSFEVPNVTAVGSEFRLMERAHGKHFMDLPEEGNALGDKRRIAKAIATLELNNIIRGLPFDDDRHGGNCKISENLISHYDFGGMMLAPPTEQELRKFAEVILNTIANTNSESDFADNYFKEIKRIKEEEGSVPPMIKSVQKAILSLGDYRRYFKDNDLMDVLCSAAVNAHPILRDAAMAKAFSGTGITPTMQEFVSKIFSPPIKVERT